MLYSRHNHKMEEASNFCKLVPISILCMGRLIKREGINHVVMERIDLKSHQEYSQHKP